MLVRNLVIFIINFCAILNSQVRADDSCKAKNSTIKYRDYKYASSNCENSQLDLDNKRSEVQYVNASHNLIRTVTDWYFENAVNLEEIDLSDNQIREISCHAFVDQKNLKDLILSRNQLENLLPGVFDSLVELKTLHLDDNRLTILQKDLLQKNGKLEKLFLHSNEISAVASRFFSSIPKGTHVTFTSCGEPVQASVRDINLKSFEKCFLKYETLNRQTREKRCPCIAKDLMSNLTEIPLPTFVSLVLNFFLIVITLCLIHYNCRLCKRKTTVMKANNICDNLRRLTRDSFYSQNPRNEDLYSNAVQSFPMQDFQQVEYANAGELVEYNEYEPDNEAQYDNPSNFK